jgi:hypothetical protein
MAEHHCHVTKCETPCPPRHLMCQRHWAMVPGNLRNGVNLYFNPTQCRTQGKRDLPSSAWLKAARAALNYVSKLEGNWHAPRGLEPVPSAASPETGVTVVNWVNDVLDQASMQSRAYDRTFEMLKILKADPSTPGWTYWRDRVLAEIDGTIEVASPIGEKGTPDCGMGECRYVEREGARPCGRCRCDDCANCGVAIRPGYHRKHLPWCPQQDWIPEHHRKALDKV